MSAQTGGRICTEIVVFGRTGPTVDDETDSRVCGRSAVVMIDRSLIERPNLYRCAEHAAPLLALAYLNGLLVMRIAG